MSDVKSEIDKLNNAIEKVSDHLDGMYDIAVDEFGEKNADIFLAQKMLLNDTGFLSEICVKIESGMVAVEAIETVADEISKKLKSTNSESIEAKSQDVLELSKRLINVINGNLLSNNSELSKYTDIIINGDDLTTSDILLIDSSKVKEIIFNNTSEFAHTVILAKARGFKVRTGTDEYNIVESLAKQTGLKTKDFLRTEYLFMNRDSYPTIEEQEQAYSEYINRICSAEDTTPVIRIFDLGGDKQTKIVKEQAFSDSFLFKRGIRRALENIDILESQILAISNVSIKCNVKIGLLVPMVATQAEVIQVKEIISKCKGNLSLGLMIETPAAAMISEELAKLCDFIMIGANDLIQYTYACDRNTKELEIVYKENPESVLRMIEIVKDNASKAGIKIDICGNTF